MKCGNHLCNHEELYFRSGTLHAIDYDPPEYLANVHVVRQKVIWLCERCSRNLRVDTWRPPGEQLHARGTIRLHVKSARVEAKSVTKSAA